MKKDEKDLLNIEDIGNDHCASSAETPLRPDAFELNDEIKMNLIESHFKSIMEILGLDLTNDSLAGTPHRVAKMYVKELFNGLNPLNKPKATLFKNDYHYNEMLVEKNISFFSNCEHHFVPIIGKAHIAYISKGHVIGLSKINRIVQYVARRPQVQERMTIQIANELKEVLKTDDVAVYIDAQHLCVSSRGIQDANSTTITTDFNGKFKESKVREDFLRIVTS
ncbi:MAG: GTP cyclohydrolase I FolE [Bacteroidia bacterium]|nr:GTP cyclohydrolase I FolE [Bacteroidia bacterium]